MGSVGSCYDNAMCESFFATLECELIHRTTFRTREEAELQVFDFIESFYNRYRRHSAIDQKCPLRYEQDNWPDDDSALATRFRGTLEVDSMPGSDNLQNHYT